AVTVQFGRRIPCHRLSGDLLLSRSSGVREVLVVVAHSIDAESFCRLERREVLPFWSSSPNPLTPVRSWSAVAQSIDAEGSVCSSPSVARPCSFNRRCPAITCLYLAVAQQLPTLSLDGALSATGALTSPPVSVLALLALPDDLLHRPLLRLLFSCRGLPCVRCYRPALCSAAAPCRRLPTAPLSGLACWSSLRRPPTSAASSVIVSASISLCFLSSALLFCVCCCALLSLFPVLVVISLLWDGEFISSTINTGHTEAGAAKTENIPVQVATIRLTKENYLQWSTAITMGIAGRGRIAYVNGRKVEPVETSVAWDTWFLEDNQVKTWIVNSVSSNIQPLILRKRTAKAVPLWELLDLLESVRTARKQVTPWSFVGDLHPKKKNSRGRSSSGKKPVSDATNLSGGKASISVEQIRELHAYLSRIDIDQAEASDDVKINHALAVSGEKDIALNWLPCFPLTARTLVFDSFFVNAPPSEAIQALVPALSNKQSGLDKRANLDLVCSNAERYDAILSGVHNDICIIFVMLFQMHYTLSPINRLVRNILLLNESLGTIS
ncbi:hypothetical protein EJ110_NYTH59709, partial [Nymphaea thermarum]